MRHSIEICTSIEERAALLDIAHSIDAFDEDRAGLIVAGLMRRWLAKLLGKTVPEYRSMMRD